MTVRSETQRECLWSTEKIPIRIHMFGSLRVTFGKEAIAGVRTNRMRSLLAFLVLNCEAPQSREHIAFLLWPESDQAQARTNLRQLLHNLRRALPVNASLPTAVTTPPFAGFRTARARSTYSNSRRPSAMQNARHRQSFRQCGKLSRMPWGCIMTTCCRTCLTTGATQKGSAAPAVC